MESLGRVDRALLPEAGGGRKQYPLETKLRIHLLQNGFSLSDPTMEETLYEITFRGLAKHTGQLTTLFALPNLWMVRRQLLNPAGEVRP